VEVISGLRVTAEILNTGLCDFTSQIEGKDSRSYKRTIFGRVEIEGKLQ
jgi:hypothetical protein